jgi:hypothetical protein
MTKISQYSTDVNITGNDKWIGSDAQNFLITKNFTPNNLAIFFNENNVIDIGTSIRYRYQTLLPGEAREQGTISFETEIGPQVNFSAITTFLIAKNTLKGNTVTQYLDFLVDGKVLLSKASNINIFGYYKITSIEPWIPNTNFFVVTVDFLAGNGFISEDLDYLVSLVDKVQDIPPPVWGSITGDIEDQTDLINYISSQIIAPTLVALPFTTDHLAITNNQYVVGDVVWYLGNVYRCIASNDSLLPTNALYWTNLGAGYPLVQQPADWNATSGNNQILNKPTIPTLTSQLTNDVPFLTQDNVVEYPDLASFPVTGVIGTIYIALDTGFFYSWNGSAYVLSSPTVTGITGVGTTNRLPIWNSPTTIGNSKVSQRSNVVVINDFARPYINGNTMFSLQRAQSQIDFILGNPGFSQPSFIVSDNQTDGFEIQSKGEFAIKTGATYVNEGLRVFSTGKLKFTQTPDTGTTSDFLLMRDTSGNVKQIAGNTYVTTANLTLQNAYNNSTDATIILDATRGDIKVKSIAGITKSMSFFDPLGNEVLTFHSESAGSNIKRISANNNGFFVDSGSNIQGGNLSIIDIYSTGNIVLSNNKTLTSYLNPAVSHYLKGISGVKWESDVKIEYAADYSALYSNRSLVDKEYVDGLITSGVTSVSATSPITSSGGSTPDISTSMATNKLIGRSTAGTGVMEEITVGTGLSLSGGTLNATAQSVGFEQNFLLMGS